MALASYLDKHQSQIYQQKLSLQKAKLVLAVGYLLITVALIIAIKMLNPSIGMSYWFGILTLAALTVGWTLSYQSQRFFKVIGGLSVFSFIGMLLVALT
ncbi:DUF3325 domain-containing protein [Acinetobacter sp. WU_MDCI_Axc73]|nr:DUF3325 domain-containing protein [Acinetobacter sp. WU_MDCI_Axc73]